MDDFLQPEKLFLFFSIKSFSMASKSDQLHFLLFPLMAQGHMIPMFDIARLLAHQGIIISIVTTPLNAIRFKQTLDRAVDSGLQIRFIEVEFPAEEAGLPKGCENYDLLPSLGLGIEFFLATDLLQDPVERLIQQTKPRPTCIISDISLPYTSRVSTKLRVPRIVFNGFSCFCMLFMHIINSNPGILESTKSESEYFPVPEFPHHIQLTKQQLPSAIIQNADVFSRKLEEAEKVTYGIIINSFEALEPEYVQEYRKVREGKVWCIGPVSLSSKHSLDKAQRGNDKATIQQSHCLKWLDTQKQVSVLYVCFGSLCNLVTPQLIELAIGLEASNTPFIWVISEGKKSAELEYWIEEEGFEERTKERGLVIRGWAPQVVILSHNAIGGFLTHCGWNSTLEGVTAGVPMITWPLFGDQFCNERLVVDVLKIGIKIGAEATVVWGEEEKIGVLVKREDVVRAILKLMEFDKESENRRKRAKDLCIKAKTAMEEGGSSYLNLKLFIQDIKQLLPIVLSEEPTTNTKQNYPI